MIPILIAVFLFGCATGAFGAVVFGVHVDEHRRNANDAHRAGRSELAARRVMGVYVRKPIDSAQSDEEEK